MTWLALNNISSSLATVKLSEVLASVWLILSFISVPRLISQYITFFKSHQLDGRSAQTNGTSKFNQCKQWSESGPQQNKLPEIRLPIVRKINLNRRAQKRRKEKWNCRANDNQLPQSMPLQEISSKIVSCRKISKAKKFSIFHAVIPAAKVPPRIRWPRTAVPSASLFLPTLPRHCSSQDLQQMPATHHWGTWEIAAKRLHTPA